MKRYALLIAWPVIEQIDALPKVRRQRLRRELLRLEETPDALIEFSEPDETGRPLHVFVFDGWAIFFWIDFADRHVKVLHMRAADRGGRA